MTRLTKLLADEKKIFNNKVFHFIPRERGMLIHPDSKKRIDLLTKDRNRKQLIPKAHVSGMIGAV